MANARICCLAGAAGVVAAQLTACGEPPIGPMELVHAQVLTAQIHREGQDRDVDVLFVIDDTVAMAGVQANLAANFGAFVEVLEDRDFRIGVTTTDAGNPRCMGAASERGALVMQPCTQRLDDFVAGDVDVRDVACLAACTLSEAELEILPTTTDHDGEAKPRPWLEHIGGETNLPAGVSLADAFECFAPQGVAGCEFQAPLESMYLALDRSVDAADPAYGFLRDWATTVIVFITNGHDCSHADAWADIFAPAGNRVFWSDPSAEAPTSAVCWNAGVACTGDPSHYDSCVAVDKDVDGALADTDEQAVLRPVQRYIDRVQGLEDLQRSLDGDHELVVAVIGGVSTDGSMSFAEAEDPEFDDAYGIGPGCTAPGGVAAVPPVRLLEFAEAFSPDNAFSICHTDYTPALGAIAEGGGPQIRPACFPGCAADLDLATDVVEPDCVLDQRAPGLDNEWLDECARNPDGSYAIDPTTNDHAMPANEVNVCFAVLVDPDGQSSDPADDLSVECTDTGFNLEFKISRRPGFPAAPGTGIYASCLLSEASAMDCPDLGPPA